MVRRIVSAVVVVVACAAGYALAAERATFVLTNGERKSGEVVFHGGRAANFIDGQLNLGDNGKEQSYPIEQVALIDFTGGTPATDELAKVPAGAAVGTSGATLNGRTVQVNANQPWTDTGIDVNVGDKVAFQANGEITFGRSAGMTATPDGNPGFHDAKYPDPKVPVGALIGRVGQKGQPFGIGSQTQPLPMPASGRLYLGVNDNDYSDNSGSYSVVVAKQ